MALKASNALLRVTLPLLVCLFADRAPAATGPQARPRTTAAHLEAGKGLFLANCASCHGERGTGHTPWPAPGLHDVVQQVGRNVVIELIRNGNGYIMPSFEDRLTRAEMETLVDYVERL